MATATGIFSGRTNHRLRLEFTQGSQSIANNTTVVNWALYADLVSGGGSYSFDVKGSWSVNIDGQVVNGGGWNYDFRDYTTKLLGSGSFTITHNTNGTKSINAFASANSQGTLGSATTNTETLTLTTIPRASVPTLSASAFDAGTAVTINTNRASTSFTHDVTYSFGAASGTIGTGIGASVSWTAPLSLLNQMPNGTSATGTITVVTKSGSTVIGSRSVTFTLRAGAAIVPDFSTITHAETVALIAAEVGAYVRNLSRLALAITGAAGVYGSTITAYRIVVAGQTINAATGTTPAPIDATGTVTIEGRITDSRGRTRTKTVNITVLDYSAPTINAETLVIERADAAGAPDPEGDRIRLDIEASVASLINSTQRNAIRYRVVSRLRGTTVYAEKVNVTPGGITFDGVIVVSTYDLEESYDLIVEISDKFQTVAVAAQITTAQVFMHWGLGLGVGKFHEQGALDVAGQIYQNDGEPVISMAAKQLAGENLDTVVTPGIYEQATVANGTLANNYPIDSTAGMLEVIAGTAHVVQRFSRRVGVTDGITYTRAKYSTDPWTSWRKVARQGADGSPFAMAAGRTECGTNGSFVAPVYWSNVVTVTLPAGRFSQAPHVVVNTEMVSSVEWASVAATPTTTSFSIRSMRINSYPTRDISWLAIQMTESSASG